MTEREKRILEFLEPNGLGGFQNISNILMELFPVADRMSHSEIIGVRQNIIDFLDGLIKADLIHMRDRPDGRMGSGNSTEGYKWLDTTPIAAAITSPGLEKLILERAKGSKTEMEKSVLTTNASIERLNGIMINEVPRQTRAMRRTALYAALAVIVAFGAIFKDQWLPDKQHQQELKAIDTLLQRQVQGLDSLNKNLQQIGQTLNKLKTGVPKVDTPKAPTKPNE